MKKRNSDLDRYPLDPRAWGSENRYWESVFLKKDPQDPEHNEEAFRRMMEEALSDLELKAEGEGEGEKPSKPAKINSRAIRALLDESPSLDLHGLTSEQARQKTSGFVFEQKQCGGRWVTVIAGKGHHSLGGRGILRDSLERLLVDLKKRGQIVDWFWDQKEKSKSGAVLVRIRD